MPAPTSAATPQASLQELRARIQRNPADGPAWLAMALLLARREPGQDLRLAIAKSIELLPDEFQAWLLAGMELQHRQGLDAALDWLQQCIQERPSLVAPRLAHAQLLSSVKPQDAEQNFLAAIEAFPEDARVPLLLAELLQNLGRPGAAADFLEKALQLQPDVAANWAALAMLRLGQGRLDAVVSASTRALELDPADSGPRLSRAEAYRQAAQWQPALEDYRQLLRIMPRNPYIHLGVGACLAGQREFDAALQALNGALNFKPDLFEARLNIALVQASQAEPGAALATLRPLLGETGLPPALRQAAEIARAQLSHQQRLPKHLQRAVQVRDLSDLQGQLKQAPEILLQSDSDAEDSLRALAAASQQANLQLTAGNPALGSAEMAFVEACILARAAESAAEMLELWHLLQQGHPASATAGTEHLRAYCRLVKDRSGLPACSLKSGNGEAWLRYWHYRMFRTSALDLPGLFKFAPNRIGLHQTTAPQHLIRSIRLLLDEIHPSLPPGPGRAAFMLVAIARIHAFIDGNGRLARFAFNGELQQARLPVILLLPQMRKPLTTCQDQALYRNDFSAFQDLLLQAQQQTQDLLGEFKAGLEKA